MEVTQHLLDTLERIARDAGAAVMEVYHSEVEHWTKDDNSPLTEADLRADRIISDALQREYPDIPILSEESEAGTLEGADLFFLVDPLDGTKEFLKRNDEFTVNIALIETGAPVAGVVFAPALGILYVAGKGLGAWRIDAAGSRSLRVSNYVEGEQLRIICSRSHAGEAMSGWLASLQTSYTFLAAGSSLKFCRVAEGLADIYPRFGPTSQWDTAAGQCILQIAGGQVLTSKGDPMLYGLRQPILNPYFFACGAGFAGMCLDTVNAA